MPTLIAEREKLGDGWSGSPFATLKITQEEIDQIICGCLCEGTKIGMICAGQLVSRGSMVASCSIKLDWSSLSRYEAIKIWLLNGKGLRNLALELLDRVPEASMIQDYVIRTNVNTRIRVKGRTLAIIQIMAMFYKANNNMADLNQLTEFANVSREILDWYRGDTIGEDIFFEEALPYSLTVKHSVHRGPI